MGLLQRGPGQMRHAVHLLTPMPLLAAEPPLAAKPQNKCGYHL